MPSLYGRKPPPRLTRAEDHQLIDRLYGDEPELGRRLRYAGNRAATSGFLRVRVAGSRRRRILFEPLGEERSYSSTSSAVPCSKHRPLFLGLEGRPSIVISGSPSGRRHPSLQQMVRRKTNDLSLGSLKDRSGTMRCFTVRTKLIEHKQPIPLPRRKPAHVSCKTTGRPRTIPTISRRIRAKRISRCRKTPCRGSDCFSKNEWRKGEGRLTPEPKPETVVGKLFQLV